MTMMLKWVDEIEKRANAATPGPWVSDDDGPVGGVAALANIGGRAIWTRHISEGSDKEQAAKDRRFVAHAREDVPRLCRAVRELHVALREVLDAYSDMAKLEEWVEDAPEPPPALERAQHRFMEARHAAKRVLERWGRGGD